MFTNFTSSSALWKCHTAELLNYRVYNWNKLFFCNARVSCYENGGLQFAKFDISNFMVVQYIGYQHETWNMKQNQKKYFWVIGFLWFHKPVSLFISNQLQYLPVRETWSSGLADLLVQQCAMNQNSFVSFSVSESVSVQVGHCSFEELTPLAV